MFLKFITYSIRQEAINSQQLGHKTHFWFYILGFRYTTILYDRYQQNLCSCRCIQQHPKIRIQSIQRPFGC